MRNSLLISIFISLSISLQIASAETADVKAKSEGCGNVTIGAVDHGKLSATNQIDCRVIHNYAVRKSVSPYERDMHRILLAKNPTEVVLTNASFSPWLDDGDRVSLNVELSNPRDLPVRAVRADLLNALSGPSFWKLKKFSVDRSQIYRTLGSETINIAAGSSVKLPVAFVDEFLMKVSQAPEGFCIYDASITANDQFSEEYQKQSIAQLMSDEKNSGMASVVTRGIPLRISMESIFEQKLVSHTWVFVAYANKASTAKIWYPSKKKFDTLRCIEPIAKPEDR